MGPGKVTSWTNCRRSGSRTNISPRLDLSGPPAIGATVLAYHEAPDVGGQPHGSLLGLRGQLVETGTTSISVNPNGVHAVGRLVGLPEHRPLVEAASSARQ